MKTVRVIQEISSCSRCPHFKGGEVYNGFSQDWFCTNQDIPDSKGRPRVGDYGQRLIAKVVEFKKKPNIPDWCPLEEVNSQSGRNETQVTQPSMVRVEDGS